MPFLDLICLANARKRSERCVAGLRADAGRWIRLVSRAEHGEFTYAQRNLGEAGEPQNFDLIRVEVLVPQPTPGQPENFLVGTVRGNCCNVLRRLRCGPFSQANSDPKM